jgi:hypothetical protein
VNAAEFQLQRMGCRWYYSRFRFHGRPFRFHGRPFRFHGRPFRFHGRPNAFTGGPRLPARHSSHGMTRLRSAALSTNTGSVRIRPAQALDRAARSFGGHPRCRRHVRSAAVRTALPADPQLFSRSPEDSRGGRLPLAPRRGGRTEQGPLRRGALCIRPSLTRPRVLA